MAGSRREGDGEPSRQGVTSQVEANDSAGFSSQAVAAIEGYTGRYLVMAKPGKEEAGMKALVSESGVQLSEVKVADSPELGSHSIKQDHGLLFPELGIAVVNPKADTFRAVATAVAQQDTLELMEPERFVYADVELDLAWLRGFRDATNEIYDRLESLGTSPGASAAPGNFDESQATWGLQATQVLRSAQTGRGIRVAILDTGIDQSHPDFRARAIAAASFIENEDVTDGNGHGTHCAGVACGMLQPSTWPRYGVAYEAELLVGKVLANSGRGTDASIIAGINWAIANRADIISMSLGAPVAVGQNYSPIFQQIAQTALDRNILIVAAAGNESRRPQELKPVGHPANCPGIMAVGAVDRSYRTAYFSNAGLNVNGGKVDIAAPGVDIYSSYPTGTPPYRRLSGTSMATPMVAGIAALYAERDGLRGNALWAQLTRQALPLQDATRDAGAGLVQA